MMLSASWRKGDGGERSERQTKIPQIEARERPE
jgi:hypothetical protein